MVKSRHIVSSLAYLFFVVFVGCASINAFAQSPQVFVSARSGADGGNCNSAQPCRTVNFALTQVQVAGQVLIVDSGDYDNSVNITKDVTITAAPGVAAVFSSAVTFGTIFNFNYGPSFCSSAGDCHVLTLRNLIFDGQGVTQDAIRAAGIKLLAEDCTFTRFKLGVYVNGGGTYQFKNCVFQFMEKGINVAPNTDGAAVRSQTLVVVEDCRFSVLSAGGVDVSTGPIGQNTLKAVIRASLFNRVGVGIRALANTGGSIQIDVEGCELTNGATGVISVSSGAVVRVSNSTIVGNTTGVAGSTGGQIFSRSNNTIEGNSTNGSFTGTFLAK